MKTIGILGGLGPESTIAYYAYITRKYHELRDDCAYPDIVIRSPSFQPYIDSGYELADEVREEICKLHRGGADFVVAACNSVHIVFDEIRDTLPIPWISIMDVTAEDIRKKGMNRIGLLGTIFTMSKGFYQRALTRHGIETLLPSEADQEEVSRIIYDELVFNVVKPESKRFVLDCIRRLNAQGAQGVILGCTELPFIAQQEDTPVPLFDTVTLHAQRALEMAMG